MIVSLLIRESSGRGFPVQFFVPVLLNPDNSRKFVQRSVVGWLMHEGIMYIKTC